MLLLLVFRCFCFFVWLAQASVYLVLFVLDFLFSTKLLLLLFFMRINHAIVSLIIYASTTQCSLKISICVCKRCYDVIVISIQCAVTKRKNFWIDGKIGTLNQSRSRKKTAKNKLYKKTNGGERESKKHRYAQGGRNYFDGNNMGRARASTYTHTHTHDREIPTSNWRRAVNHMRDGVSILHFILIFNHVQMCVMVLCAKCVCMVVNERIGSTVSVCFFFYSLGMGDSLSSPCRSPSAFVCV